MKSTVLKTVWRSGDSRSPAFSSAPTGNASDAPVWALLDKPLDGVASYPITTIRGGLAQRPNDRFPVLGHAPTSPRDGWVGIVQPRESELSLWPSGDTKLGVGVPLDGIEDLEGNLESVSIVSGGVTHTLKFNRRAGGIIDSWVRDGGSGAVELLNRGNRLSRGVQAGMHISPWIDGRFLKHDLAQGGDRFSEAANALYRFSGVMISLEVKEEGFGGTSISVVTIPCDLDPDGSMAVPGIEGDHGGGRGRGVLWEDVRLHQKLWINWRGKTDVHHIETSWVCPESRVGGFFDWDASTAMFLDADAFGTLRAWDAENSVDSTLSSGVVGTPNYQANDRVYSMNRATLQGDEESVAAASVITSGKGGVGFAGATASDLAVMCVADTSGDSLVETAKSLNAESVTGWKWAQNRGATSGRDGDGYAMLASGRFLTGRFHPVFSKRLLSGGAAKSGFWLCTESWTATKALASGILGV